MTHYVPFDSPGWNARVAQTVCGKFIDPRSSEFSASPTCDTCRAWVHQDDGKTAEDMFGSAPTSGQRTT